MRYLKICVRTCCGRSLPVLPVTISGSRRVFPKGDMVFHPGKIEVVVDEPIETSGYTQDRMDELIDKTRDTIISNFNPDYPVG